MKGAAVPLTIIGAVGLLGVLVACASMDPADELALLERDLKLANDMKDNALAASILARIKTLQAGG